MTPSRLDARRAFLAEVDRLAAVVVAAAEPDDAAAEIWSLGMGSIPAVGDWAHATWLIWGALTDGIDSPRADDDGRRRARDGMRRAASQWLDLDPSDASAVDAYLDRWVYDECGYTRPGT